MPITDDEYAQLYGRDPNRGTTETGNVDAGWGTRFGASVDRAQAGLYGIAEAAGIPGAGARRRENQVIGEANSRVAGENAEIPDSFRDVTGVRSGLRYLGGLAVDSAPQMGAMLAAGAVGGLPAAGAVGYAGAVGDVLQNQREQSGMTNGRSAALYALPYAAVDTLTGVGGHMARGTLARGAVQALDDIRGARGGLARAGATVLKEGAVEGAGESFQEVMNQAGRMSVDPNETLFSPEANERYLESFVGGAALGGAMGGVTGWRRSRAPVTPDTPKDLLAGEFSTSQGFEGLGRPPAEQAISLLGDTTPDWSTSQGAAPVGPEIERVDAAGLYPAVDEAPLVPEGMGLVPQTERLTNTEIPVVRDAPNLGADTMGVDFMGNVAGTDLQNEQQLDPGAVEARRQWQEADRRQRAIKEQADATAAEITARDERAKSYGLQGNAAFDTFGMLEAAHREGTIEDADFAENVGLLKARKFGQVKKFLKGMAETQAAIAQSDADMAAAPAKALADRAAAEADATSTQIPTNAAQTTQPPAQASQTPSPEGSTQAAPAAEGPSPGTRLIEGMEKATGRKFTPLAKERLFSWAGLDNDGHQVAGKRTLDEVAAIEASRRGGTAAKSRQAIAKMLAGLKVNEALVDGFIDRLGRTDTADETGVTENADGDLVQRQAAEDSTPTESDEATLDEAGGADAGMRSVASPNSSGIVEPEGDRATRVKKELRRLSRAQEFDDVQRAQFDRVAKIKGDPERALAVKAILQNKSLFSPEERTMLTEVLEADPASETRARAVAEQQGIDLGPSQEMIEQNRRIIEANEAFLELQKLEGAATGTTKEVALLEALPVTLHNDIADAQDSWSEDLLPGEPTWDDLSVKEQASWVKAVVANNTPTSSGKPMLSAQGLVRRSEELKDEANSRRNANRDSAQTGEDARRGAERAPDQVPGPVARSEVAPAGAAEAPARQGQGRNEAAAPASQPGEADATEEGASDGVTRYEYPVRRRGMPDAEYTLQKAAVDFLNGDIDHDQLVSRAADAYRDGVEDAVVHMLLMRTQEFTEGDAKKARAEAGVKLSVAATEDASTVESLRAEIATLVPEMSRRVSILQSINDLPTAQRESALRAAPAGKTIQGFVAGAKVYLFADGIKKGNGRAVFMHEVGGHLGIDIVFGEQQEALAGQVYEWANRDDGSVESNLAKLAIDRVANARTPSVDVNSEVIAYFLEEAVKAGIDPTAAGHKTALDRFFSAVRQAMKAALGRFMNVNQMTAQDMVDIAYGAIAKVNEMDEDMGAGPIRFSVASDRSLPRIPPRVAQAQTSVGRYIKSAAKQGVRWMAFTEDLANMAKGVLPSVTKYMDLMRESSVLKTRQERNIERVLDVYKELPAKERGNGPGSVNAFIRESTMDKKWGFEPGYHENVTVDPDMELKFKALSPKAQELVRQVFKHGHETLQEMKRAVSENITSEHDAQIAEAKEAGDTAKVTQLEADKAKALRDYQTMMNIGGDWPYAPLKRFGNHVAIGMSQAYLDAEKAGDNALMRSMQSDENHYFVTFAETRAEAQRLKDELGQKYAYSDNFEKDGAHDQMYGGRDTLGAFRRLRTLVENTADEGLQANANKALNRLMNDLHLTLLSENSARQSERNRLNVAGADKDMMRAFATQGRATAHFLSALKNSGKIQDALRDMQKEADARAPGREQRRDYYNEMLRRHVMGMDWKPTPVIDRAMAATSAWMLLTSPAYVLTNLTQPLVMSLPVIAGTHGYARASAAMLRSYRDIMPLLKDGKFTEDDYNKLPADVQDAINALVNRGRIDISLEQDLGRWRSDQKSAIGRVLPNTMDWLRGVTSTAESVNRLVTAMAAIRLEAARGASPAQQVAYADKVIYDTHGDYSGFNAPRVMRAGVGRLVTQFRKFQLIQIAMYTKLLKGSYNEVFKGAGRAEKWAASKALAFSLGHMFVLGGALGMPGAQAVGWVLRQVFGDDDEPDNPELTMRKMIGDNDLADLLLKGAPKLAGVDLSGRLGAGGMLSLLPFSDPEVSRKGVEGMILQATGPFVGGLLPRWADGVDMMSKGNYYKGMEALLPKGLADAAKGARLATQGMTQRNGDLVMSPDDISVLDGAIQALGFQTNTLTDRSFRASAKFTTDKFFDAKVGELKREYVEAYRAGDTEGMAEARERWKDLQASRQGNGYKVQPLAELIKAPREQGKREKNTAGGVQYRTRQEGMVKQLTTL
jgi:hypothetical protein